MQPRSRPGFNGERPQREESIQQWLRRENASPMSEVGEGRSVAAYSEAAVFQINAGPCQDVQNDRTPQQEKKKNKIKKIIITQYGQGAPLFQG